MVEGRGQSLVNEIFICAKALRSWFLRSFNVICKLDTFFEITNHRVIPTFFSTKQKTISQRDKLWFVGVSIVTSCDLLANIGNFHAFAKCIVHRCVHYVGTLQRFLWLTEISETRIPAISKTCLSDKEIEKREIKPKPPRRRRLCCPPPLLPAAPSRRQTLSQSLLFPPPVVAAPPRRGRLVGGW
jgi:hypothetical protein